MKICITKNSETKCNVKTMIGDFFENHTDYTYRLPAIDRCYDSAEDTYTEMITSVDRYRIFLMTIVKLNMAEYIYNSNIKTPIISTIRGENQHDFIITICEDNFDKCPETQKIACIDRMIENKLNEQKTIVENLNKTEIDI